MKTNLSCTWVIFVASAALLLLSGCLIVAAPVPMSTATTTPDGRNKLVEPKDKVVAGVTTRAQLEELYKGFGVETGTDRLFWGQYKKSNMGVAYAAGVLYAGGDQGEKRIYHGVDILASFDEKGVVTSFYSLPDDQSFARIIEMQHSGLLGPYRLQIPFTLQAGIAGMKSAAGYRLDFEKESVTITKNEYIYPSEKSRVDEPPSKVIKVPLNKIDDIVRHTPKSGVTYCGDSSQHNVLFNIKFKETTELGRSINMCASTVEVLKMLRWMADREVSSKSD